MLARAALTTRPRRWLWLSLPLVAGALVSCASLAQDQTYGAYLTGRVASMRDDAATATRSLLQAASGAREVVSVQAEALHVLVVDGDFSEARRIADQLHEAGERHWLAELVRYVDFMLRNDIEEARASARDSNLPIGRILEFWAEAADGDRLLAADALAELDEPFATLGKQYQWLSTQHLGVEPDPQWIADETGWRARRTRAVLAANAGEAEALRLHLESASVAFGELVVRQSALDGSQEFLKGEISARTGAAWTLVDYASLFGRRARDPMAIYRLAERLQPEMDEVKTGLLSILRDDTLRSWIEENVAGSRRANPRLQVAAAGALRRIGDKEAGLAMMDDVASRHPDDSTVLESRASTYLSSDQYEVAREAFTDLLELYGASAAKVEAASAGDTLAERADYAVMIESRSARREFVEALLVVAETEPWLWHIYFQRGICSERLGDWSESEADLLRSLELDPDQPHVINYLAYSWVDRGVNLERGMEMLERAVAMRPNNGHIIDSLGWAKYRLGDLEGALADLERAVQRAPAEPEIYDHLGDVLWHLGNTKEARYQWRRVLTLEADDEMRASVESKLMDGLPERAL